MVLEKNQHVAACVPYTKKKNEWIVARIERWEDGNNSYIVKDLFPDKRKKVHSWQVPPENVIRFPSLDSDVFVPGDRVLSLWRVDSEEWSSMFYRATVVEAYGDMVDSTNLRLCFEGDSEIHEVPRSKAIKFEKPSTRAAQSRNGIGISSNGSRVRRLPPGMDNPPNKRHKSSDESCSTDDSDPDSFAMRDETPYLYRGYSVLEKKMRNYRSILLERYNEAHKATLLNI